jgi:transposase-like protein
MAGWRCPTSPTPSGSPAVTEVQGKLPAVVKEPLKDGPDGPREIVCTVLREVLEAGMADALGAARGERTGAGLACRSGYHGRSLITRTGRLELRVPQDRGGRFSTELFERYRSEQAPVAMLAEMDCRTSRPGRWSPQGPMRARLLGLGHLSGRQAAR